MAKEQLTKIFLSASIPTPDRDPKYYGSADIIAIRDSVRALATVVIPNAHLIWGGHPAITPLIRHVLLKMDSNLKEHVTIYQSNFFKQFFPADNLYFENVIQTDALPTRDASLELMRTKMLSNNNFSAGIFIGGMEGVIEEYKLFKNAQPNALILPVASTGAAAKILFSDQNGNDMRLLNDYAYMAMFKDLLKKFI